MSYFGDKDKLSGVVLAGGDNKRFPILKGFLRINGITIIEKNINLLQTICNDVFISTNMPELYFKFQINMYGDIIASMGPMSGIYTSLLNSKNDNLLVVACDMPFLNEGVLSYILKKHIEMNKNFLCDATVPFYNNRPQPLCGIYRKTALPLLEENLQNNKNSMYFFLREVKTNFISEAEIKEIDASGSSFININTLEDYKMIKGMNMGLSSYCPQPLILHYQ